MNTYKTLEFRFSESRGKGTWGYNICSLYVDGRKVSSCKGGGYDMQGESLGDWVAREYADRLLTLKDSCFYGLTFHNPNYDPGKAKIGSDCHDRTLAGAEGETVEQAEKNGKSFGLERYQAFHSASSKFPTRVHRRPLIHGACGMESVREIMQAIKLEMEYITKSSNATIYRLHDRRRTRAKGTK